MSRVNPHKGRDFDDFLAEDNLLAEAQVTAENRVLAFQVEQAMKEQPPEKRC